MLVNQKQIKQYLKDHNKRTSREFLDVLDAKIRVIINRGIFASNNFKTVKGVDIASLSIRREI
ncbi:MAG: hypothetical protein KAU12_00280 [Candidatus Omnitrophica bacterium]|nr:hypothetical protein [Candidatus Omnitrophota bacterium]